MFGYVNVYKDELKIKDYNIYKAYYCGLCKTLGKRHNQTSRLLLNYDFAFLALLCDSLKEEKSIFSREGCVKRIGKRLTVKHSHKLDFVADMNLYFTYLKLKDDISDNKSVKAFFAVLPFLLKASKIKKCYPELCEKSEIHLKRLSFLEKDKCEIIDKVAHEFASILEAMFVEADPKLKEIGYVLGRFIYIVDACDDMISDYKKGTYNPLCMQYEFDGTCTKQMKEELQTLLYNSLSDLADAYGKLKILKNKTLLDNIIYRGIRAKCDYILNERMIDDERSV